MVGVSTLVQPVIVPKVHCSRGGVFQVNFLVWLGVTTQLFKLCIQEYVCIETILNSITDVQCIQS